MIALVRHQFNLTEVSQFYTYFNIKIYLLLQKSQPKLYWSQEGQFICSPQHTEHKSEAQGQN